MAITQRIEDAATKAACDTWCQYDAMIQRAHHVEDHDADPEDGSTTVEYAIGAVAAAGFAGLLLVVLKSGAVKSLLQGIIQQALSL